MSFTLLTLAATACGLSWWALAAATALGAPRLIRHLERLAPPDRSWCLLGLTLFPPLLAIAVTILVFLAPHGIVAINSHCHGNACGAHAPFVASSATALIAFSAIAGAVIAAWVVITALALWRASRITRTFAALTRPGADGSFRVLDCDGFLACCVGIWQPKIVVSRKLAATADPDQLGIVLLHEYAHACRSDNLRKLLAGLATLPWPRSRRKLVLEALNNAADQCCDAFVAREIGNPDRVADTIRLVSRWSGGTDVGSERAVCGRIETLRRSHREDGQLLRIYAVVIPLVLAAIATAAPALHYCSEAFLRLF